jgi:uncharacterized protein
MAVLRVVLDTNVLLSGIAYPESVPGKLVNAWRQGAIDVVLSAFILDELRRVLPRLGHRHGLSTAEIDDLVDALFIQAELVEPIEVSVSALRDDADAPVLGTLLAALEAAKVDCLITGDKDLLALAEKYPIVAPTAFWAAHAGI